MKLKKKKKKKKKEENQAGIFFILVTKSGGRSVRHNAGGPRDATSFRFVCQPRDFRFFALQMMCDTRARPASPNLSVANLQIDRRPLPFRKNEQKCEQRVREREREKERKKERERKSASNIEHIEWKNGKK